MAQDGKASDDDFAGKCLQIILESLYKVTETVLQARVTLSGERDARPKLNFDIPVLKDVRASLSRWRYQPHVPLTIELFYKSDSSEPEVLAEQWTLYYEAAAGPTSRSVDQVDLLHLLYKEACVLVRAVFGTLRTLPLHDAFRAGRGLIRFRLFASMDSTGSLGAAGASETIDLPPIVTPFGSLMVGVRFLSHLSPMLQETKSSATILTPFEFISDYIPSPAEPPKVAPAPPLAPPPPPPPPVPVAAAPTFWYSPFMPSVVHARPDCPAFTGPSNPVSLEFATNKGLSACVRCRPAFSRGSTPPPATVSGGSPGSAAMPPVAFGSSGSIPTNNRGSLPSSSPGAAPVGIAIGGAEGRRRSRGQSVTSEWDAEPAAHPPVGSNTKPIPISGGRVPVGPYRPPQGGSSAGEYEYSPSSSPGQATPRFSPGTTPPSSHIRRRNSRHMSYGSEEMDGAGPSPPDHAGRSMAGKSYSEGLTTPLGPDRLSPPFAKSYMHSGQFGHVDEHTPGDVLSHSPPLRTYAPGHTLGATPNLPPHWLPSGSPPDAMASPDAYNPFQALDSVRHPVLPPAPFGLSPPSSILTGKPSAPVKMVSAGGLTPPAAAVRDSRRDDSGQAQHALPAAAVQQRPDSGAAAGTAVPFQQRQRSLSSPAYPSRGRDMSALPPRIAFVASLGWHNEEEGGESDHSSADEAVGAEPAASAPGLALAPADVPVRSPTTPRDGVEAGPKPVLTRHSSGDRSDEELIGLSAADNAAFWLDDFAFAVNPRAPVDEIVYRCAHPPRLSFCSPMIGNSNQTPPNAVTLASYQKDVNALRSMLQQYRTALQTM